MKLDIVIPIKTDLLEFAIKYSIPSVQKNLTYNKLYIVTKKENFSKLIAAFSSKITCIDEDKLAKNLSFELVQKKLSERNANTKRTGWYFQQFLKLEIALLDYISNHYLVWDADSIALKPIQFFSKKNKILYDKTSEFHAPYFEITEKLIQLPRQVNYSFISEHLVFKKSITKTLIQEISRKSDLPWWHIVLKNIDDNYISGSGFSEYELYGNYVLKYHPDKYKLRRLNKNRGGKPHFGMQPNKLGLKLFSIPFHYISFELWHQKNKPKIKRYLKIVLAFFSGSIKLILKSIQNTMC